MYFGNRGLELPAKRPETSGIRDTTQAIVRQMLAVPSQFLFRHFGRSPMIPPRAETFALKSGRQGGRWWTRLKLQLLLYSC